MFLCVPLASNQAAASPETRLDQALGAIDIPLIDLNWYGGFRASVIAARMPELLGRGFATHSSMETATSKAAQLHLAACVPNLPYASDSHYLYLESDLSREDRCSSPTERWRCPQVRVWAPKWTRRRWRRFTGDGRKPAFLSGTTPAANR